MFASELLVFARASGVWSKCAREIDRDRRRDGLEFERGRSRVQRESLACWYFITRGQCGVATERSREREWERERIVACRVVATRRSRKRERPACWPLITRGHCGVATERSRERENKWRRERVCGVTRDGASVQWRHASCVAVHRSRKRESGKVANTAGAPPHLLRRALISHIHEPPRSRPCAAMATRTLNSEIIYHYGLEAILSSR